MIRICYKNYDFSIHNDALNKLSNDLSKLLFKCGDMKVKLSNGEFPVISYLLMARSNVFKKNIEWNGANCHTIDLSMYDSEIVTDMFKYIYTSVLPHYDLDESDCDNDKLKLVIGKLVELLYLSDMYTLDELVIHIMDLINNKISLDTAAIIRDSIVDYGLLTNPFIEKCNAIITEHHSYVNELRILYENKTFTYSFIDHDELVIDVDSDPKYLKLQKMFDLKLKVNHKIYLIPISKINDNLYTYKLVFDMDIQNKFPIVNDKWMDSFHELSIIYRVKKHYKDQVSQRMLTRGKFYNLSRFYIDSSSYYSNENTSIQRIKLARNVFIDETKRNYITTIDDIRNLSQTNVA